MSDLTNFTAIPNDVLCDTRLTMTARVAYAMLRHQAYLAGQRKPEEGAVLPPVEEIALALGCSRAALNGYLSELRKARLVVSVRTGRGNHYWIFPRPITAAEAEGLKGDKAAVRRLDTGHREALVPLRGKDIKTDVLTDVCRETSLSVPDHVKTDGRDLAFDAIQDVCGIQPGSPRLVSIPVALHGRGSQTGIRAMFWRELVEYATVNGRLGELSEITPQQFVELLAKRVYVKARKYLERMPEDTSLTPTALRNWWLDIENRKQRADVPLSREQVRAIIGD